MRYDGMFDPIEAKVSIMFSCSIRELASTMGGLNSTVAVAHERKASERSSLPHSPRSTSSFVMFKFRSTVFIGLCVLALGTRPPPAPPEITKTISSTIFETNSALVIYFLDRCRDASTMHLHFPASLVPFFLSQLFF